MHDLTEFLKNSSKHSELLFSWTMGDVGKNMTFWHLGKIEWKDSSITNIVSAMVGQQPNYREIRLMDSYIQI